MATAGNPWSDRGGEPERELTAFWALQSQLAEPAQPRDLDGHADVSDVLDEDATARKLAATREALGKQRAANEALKSELSAATEVRARASSMIAKRAIDSASLFSQREAQLERENEILQDNTRALFNEAKARQARAASARRGAHVSALPSAHRVRCRRR